MAGIKMLETDSPGEWKTLQYAIDQGQAGLQENNAYNACDWQTNGAGSLKRIWQNECLAGRMPGLKCSQEGVTAGNQALIPLIGNNSQFNSIHG